MDRRFVVAACMMVMVLASMEQTITSTAMPTIIGELHGLEHYAWVASIYLLACTVSMPLYGRLADMLGRKVVVLTAIGVFCASSVLAASAHTMNQLIVYRGLQGLGAGGIMPVVLTILGDLFTLEERAKIQGAFSAVWGTASLAGPALGAFLVKAFGWRSIFFVNLPFGAIGLAVLIWKYHDTEEPHRVDLDLPGAGALAVACMSILLLASGLGPDGWSHATAACLAVAAVLSSVYFVRHERRVEHPILPLNLLSDRHIGPSLAGSALLGLGFLSLDTYVPLYVQGGRGGGVGAAATVVTPVMLTWALSGVFAAPLLVRWGFRKTALLGSTLVIVGFTGLLACAMTDAPHAVLTGVLALTGLGLGPASMSYLLAAQNAVAYRQRGVVTGSIQFVRTMGGAVGIGVLGALFNILIRDDLARLKGRGATPAAMLDPKLHGQLAPDVLAQVEHMIAHGLIWVFVAMLVFAVLQWAVTLLMPVKRPDHAVTAAEAAEALAG